MKVLNTLIAASLAVSGVASGEPKDFMYANVSGAEVNSSPVAKPTPDSDTGEVSWEVTPVAPSAERISEPPVQASVQAEKSEVVFAEIPAAYRADPKVVIKNVSFKGNTVISDSALANVAESFLARPVEMTDLEELRIRLTRLYTDQGYVNSGAILPAQQVDNGQIEYQIVEGTLESVNIEGAGRLRNDYIASRVLKNAASPFNTKTLESNFRELLDNPLIERMDGELSALPGQGTSALNLKIKRATPYNFTVEGNNHASPSLGAEQIRLSGLVRNISGFGDALSVTAVSSDSRTSLSTGYSVPLNSNDTTLTIQVSASDSGVIEEPLDTIDIESSTEGVDLSLSHPLRSSLQKRLAVGVGLAVRKNQNLLAGEPFPFSTGEVDGASKVSVLRTWQDYVRRKGAAVLAARSTFKLGLDAFGATQHNDSRPDGQFISWQAQLQYARRYLEDRAQLLLKMDAQVANHELLPLERFSIGGANSVRGYRENEVVRDQAVFVSAEYRYRLGSSDNFGTWTLAPFFDAG